MPQCLSSSSPPPPLPERKTYKKGRNSVRRIQKLSVIAFVLVVFVALGLVVEFIDPFGDEYPMLRNWRESSNDDVIFMDFDLKNHDTFSAGKDDDSKKCTFNNLKDLSSVGSDACVGVSDVCILYDNGCTDDDDGLIDYIGFYCTFSVGWVCVVFLYIPWLVVIFYLLGMTAEDYFCPVLNIISDKLSLSPDVAGITILALGNGSPDVFSTFVAIQTPPDGFKIAIGELIGAGCFVTMAVVGAVAVVANCNVQKVAFIRDVTFYMGAVLIVVTMVSFGEMHIYESLLLLIGYCCYVGVSVAMNYFGRTKKRDEERLLNESDGEEDDDDDLNDVDVFSEAEEEKRKVYLAKVGIVVQDDDAELRVSSRPDGSLSPRRVRREEVDPNYEVLPQIEPASNLGSINLVAEDIDEFDDGVRGGERTGNLFVSYLEAFKKEIEWYEKDKKEKVLYILFSPFILMFNLCIPIPDEDNFNRWWLILSPIFVPFFFFLVMEIITISVGPIPVILILELISFPLSFFIYKTTNPHSPPTYKSAFVVVAFVMSIFWIYVIANELVTLLQSLGDILGIPPDVMGLTVLAWGNSVGDMVSNVIVAQQGFPGMALAATYGGPLFNLFLGLGLSITFWTAANFPDPYCVSFTATVGIALVFLIINLIVTLCVVWYYNFHIPKRYSAVLIGWYSTYMLLAVLNKSGVITF
eukprot:CAMPEP_0201478494 /NCGR_PEP_ID=MMETSP0151_2-20130828/3308_1 /ASSEMBLY_ACC=CAM_ASM_000257 /TAXON_ID=200890 /ORGANISM="Paramoeba atlantica, Strain 621/1 / CCAP 1560/9" /LENGTH=693 /DNA_ID=CAMNT_0047859577 /DNA_START=39 /DNA_END=2120 /DNA_ORIENTATION=+